MGTAISALPMPLPECAADRGLRRPLLCGTQGGYQTRGLFPYDERLRLLTFYLQQLEMELNGKSVTTGGKSVSESNRAGGVGRRLGTDAQHAVFQLLHQGTVLVPVEFIAVREGDDNQDPEQHRLLLLNAFAQGAALMRGRQASPTRSVPMPATGPARRCFSIV